MCGFEFEVNFNLIPTSFDFVLCLVFVLLYCIVFASSLVSAAYLAMNFATF